MSSNNQDRHDRTELTLSREKCFLVGAEIPGRYNRSEEPLSELEALLEAVDAEVVGSITQKLDKPHNKYYLGKGKFYDMVDAARESGADTIVVDDDITATQLGNIEEAARLKVIDRSEVILDIFMSRARSHQAMMQVEMAQLQYELPRLARKWTHLERLGGGIGTRGPGESQIETDRRIIRRKIAKLRVDLKEIEDRKIREVAGREKSFTACLVGYTNAGKSSLLNKMTGGDAFVEDMLFATLDTLTRKLELPNGMNMLLSDTVGFIRRLPHHLVASFHATLEEASQADLLLHVIDGSDTMALEHARSVDATLAELGMQDKDRIFVLNKCDLLEDEALKRGILSHFEPAIFVSAKSGEGIDELLQELINKALGGLRRVKVRFSAGDGKRLAVLNQVGLVEDTVYEGSEVTLTATLKGPDYERICKMPGEMVEVE